MVIERAAAIGGAIATRASPCPGFRHDLYATNLSLFTGSSFYRDHAAELERAGLRFITCHEAFASAYSDGTAVRVTTDPERTQAEFARCSTSRPRGLAQPRRNLSAHRPARAPLHKYAARRQRAGGFPGAAHGRRPARGHARFAACDFRVVRPVRRSVLPYRCSKRRCPSVGLPSGFRAGRQGRCSFRLCRCALGASERSALSRKVALTQSSPLCDG